MSRIPAASLACRDGGAWRAGVALLQGVALASVLVWLLHPLAGVLGLWPVWRAWQQAALPAPWLAWDGQTWRLDGQPGHAQVALDLGVWLLLRFDGEPAPGGVGGQRRQRVWLPCSAAAGAWAPLRAALYATAWPALGASASGVVV